MMRRVVGVIAAVVLAMVGTAVLVMFVRGAEARALAGQETVEVLVVKEPIDKETTAEDRAAFVTTERIPAKVRAADSVADLGDLDGQVAAVDLVPGEQLVRTRFVTPAQLAEQSQVEVPEGLQEVTIAIEPQRAVGGQLRPGDTVGFYSSFDLQDEREEEQIAAEENPDYRQELAETTKVILHGLLVTNVQVEQLPQQTVSDEADDGPSGPDLAPTGNLLVTLAVDTSQAERIVFTAEHGMVWLTSQDEDTTTDGSQLRVPRNIYDD
jgi:pilus assembly protein CpaB